MRIWFDRGPRVRWRRVLAATVLGVTTVVALLLRGSATGHAMGPVATAGASAVAFATPRVSPPMLAPSKIVMAPDEFEACGGFRLKLDAGGSPLPNQAMEASARDVRARTLAAMRASSDELARAAALYIDRIDAATGGAAALDALARSAVSTRDPRIYALAVQACSRIEDGAQAGACGMLSAQQWSQLDRDNAMPWLTMASQARARKDAAGLADAMHHIAKARTADTGWSVVPSMVLAHAPDGDAAMLGTSQLLVEVIGIQAAVAIPGYQVVTQYCREDALRDANRRQTCVDIAEVLATKSTTTMDQMIGGALGRRVGWPAERQASFAATRDARMAATLLTFDQGPNALSCKSVEHSLNYLREVAAHGEVEAQRLLIERSGKSIEELQRLHRAQLEQLTAAYEKQRAAEEAASAASR